MRDSIAIFRKELQEIAGARDSRQAGAIQILVMGLAFGVLFPIQHPEAWNRWAPSNVVYYALGASLLGAGLAADAFAGERDRRTLETLMTTPASEFDILLGKVWAVVVFGLIAAIFPWSIALVITAGRGVPMGPAPLLTCGFLWITACATFASGMLAIGVSLRTTSARASQQINAVLILMVFGGTSFVWRKLSLPHTLGALSLAGLIALILGGLALCALSRWFRRDRIFARG